MLNFRGVIEPLEDHFPGTEKSFLLECFIWTKICFYVQPIDFLPPRVEG